ncbi:MAG: permease of the drug/metabolite transporter superfamily [Rickettsiales bacterium]|jgi:O-acetylserine/cysteine efflux transporter|nr:permease of the drug/metabolite transporter superfamily [Rickettsiales bacterium]
MLSLPHLILALVVTLLWGLNFVFSKAALGHFSPFFLLVLRMVLVSVLLIPFYRRPPLPIPVIARVMFSFAVLHLGFMYASLYFGLASSIGAVVQQLAIPSVLLLGVVLFKEKIGWRSIMGVLLAISGTFVLMGAPNSIEHPMAFLFMVGSAVSWAFYSIGLKRLPPVAVLPLVAWISLLAVIPMGVISFAVEEGQVNQLLTMTLPNLGALLYIAIGGSIVSHGLWFYLLTKNPVNLLAPLILLVPLFGVIGGVVLMDEPLSFTIMMGTGLMLAGVGIVTLRRPQIAKTDIDA